jgi:membrane carboxypeptidase/penicillin-binding protein
MILQRRSKIYTTIDSRMQLHAEEAVSATWPTFKKFQSIKG